MRSKKVHGYPFVTSVTLQDGPTFLHINTFGQGETLGTLGTLRSNDADGEENVKKTIGFISKTTALHVHHTFFVHFFPVFAELRRENA